jgi:hypothetical protein
VNSRNQPLYRHSINIEPLRVKRALHLCVHANQVFHLHIVSGFGEWHPWFLIYDVNIGTTPALQVVVAELCAHSTSLSGFPTTPAREQCSRETT